MHTELLNDRSTDEILNGLRRAFARRGRPCYIFADGEKGFKRIDMELQQIYTHVDLKQIKKGLGDEGIEFLFNCPRSPHRNGSVEIMNRTLKRVINAKLGRKNISTTELATLLTIAEGIVNSRPLAVTRESDEQKIITPAMLAINRDIRSIPPYKFDRELRIPHLRSTAEVNKRKKYLDLLHTQFWRKWLFEYLDNLMIYRKNLTKGRPLKAQDVVLIKDTSLQVRGQYPLGIVETAKESLTWDHVIRSAVIRIPPIDGRREKIITQPLEMIAPLEITDEEVPYE